MSSIYTDLQLQNARDIRLLSLYPAENLNDTLCGKLRVVNLAKSGHFEALSYTWGPPFEDQVLEDDNIELSGDVLKITGNLGHALRRLRLSTEPMRLWVDAICIDQQNTRERGHQVGIMSQIFCSASCVYAWLGEDSKHRDGEFFFTYQDLNHQKNFQQEINEIESIRDLIPSRSAPMPRGVFDAERLSRSYTLACKLGKTFESRRYFARRWVLQEQIVAQDIIFVCGQWRIRYFKFVNDILSLSYFSGIRGLYWTGNSRVIRGQITRAVVRTLKACQNTKCSDSRDIVLAFASLWKHIDLQVDYSMSTEEVYVALAEAIVKSIDNSEEDPYSPEPERELRELLATAASQSVDHCTEMSSYLPSWSPDWRKDVHEGVPDFEIEDLRGLPSGSHDIVQLNARVSPGRKLHLTLAYYGRLGSSVTDFIATDTLAPTRDYYIVSGGRCNRFATFSTSGYVQHLLKSNKPVDGIIICSMKMGRSILDLDGSLILQLVNEDEQEYRILGEVKCARSDRFKLRCDQRQFTIV